MGAYASPSRRFVMRVLQAIFIIACVTACTETARLPESAGQGPDPQLPPPNQAAIPTIVVADAKGWPAGVTPKAAPGMRVTAFATGLEHPRWVQVLPNGDVLVAESAAPARPDEGKGL